MSLSRQRLEDNPANYDGLFEPSSSPSYASTSYIRPVSLPPSFEKWKIYPPPPEPHWKERDPDATEPPAVEGGQGPRSEEERTRFEFAKCEVPSREEGRKRTFRLDEGGVYQVYDQGALLSYRPLVPLAVSRCVPRLARGSRTVHPALHRTDHQGILPGPRRRPQRHLGRPDQVVRVQAPQVPREQVEPVRALERVSRARRNEGEFSVDAKLCPRFPSRCAPRCSADGFILANSRLSQVERRNFAPVGR